jgi:hypothetical protein
MGGKAMDNLNETKKISKRKRNHYIGFCVTEQEREMIHQRMAQTGIKNLRAYMLKMGVDGQVIHVELSSVKEMVRLLSNATNNINQIAKRANTDGSIYAADIDELREKYDEIWDQAKVILRKLAEM